MIARYFFIVLFSILFTKAAIADTSRIMLLGDSITYDYAFSDDYNPRPISQRHGFRNYLWYKLKAAKYDVDFVGTNKAGSGIRPSFDIDNEGFPGLKSTEVVYYPRPEGGFYDRLKRFKPHIILIHLGTNDWSTSVSGMRKILDEIDNAEEDYGFHATVVLAKIINLRERKSIFSTFNRNLQALADSRVKNGDDIIVVDMENGAGLHYNSTDFRDRVHPNNAGYQKMANVWFGALKKILDNRQNDSDFLIPIYGFLLN